MATVANSTAAFKHLKTHLFSLP